MGATDPFRGISGKPTLAEYGKPSYTGNPLYTSAQAIPIPIMWGTRRIAPQVVWASLNNGEPVIAGANTVIVDGPDTSPFGTGYQSTGSTQPVHWAIGAFQFNFANYVDAAWMFFGEVKIGSGALLTGSNTNHWGSADFSSAHWFVPTIFGLCEGPVDSILRFWSGGNQNAISTAFPNPYNVDPPLLFYTLFSGTGTQTVPQWFTDVSALGGGLYPPIVAQGMAYRLLAYLFTPIADWGNDLRPPQQSFEVLRMPVPSAAKADSYGFGAFDYAPDEIIFDFLTNITYGMGFQLGDFDAASFTQYMQYVRAQGIYFSPLLDSQTSATDIIDRWALLTNSWIYWNNGFVFVPLGDEALTGNGQTFTPDQTAAYDLTNDDFLPPGVKVTRKRPVDCYNRVRIEISDRGVDYAKNPLEWKDETLISQFKLRDASDIDADDICDPAVGIIVVGLIGQRMAYLRKTYSFQLPSAKFIRLVPGSIVTLTDPDLGLNLERVRISGVSEDENYVLSIDAEELPGTLGIARPMPYQPWTQSTGGSAGGAGTGGSGPGGFGTPISSSGGTLTAPSPPTATTIWGFVVAGDSVIMPANPVVGVTYEFTHDRQRVPQPTPPILETNPVTFHVGSAPLPGTVSVTNGLPNITFSTAQTLVAGQGIIFASQPTVTYTLSGPVSGTSGTLTSNYTGTTNAATTAFAVATWLFEDPQDRKAAPLNPMQWMVSGKTLRLRFDGTLMRCLDDDH